MIVLAFVFILAFALVRWLPCWDYMPEAPAYLGAAALLRKRGAGLCEACGRQIPVGFSRCAAHATEPPKEIVTSGRKVQASVEDLPEGSQIRWKA